MGAIHFGDGCRVFVRRMLLVFSVVALVASPIIGAVGANAPVTTIIRAEARGSETISILRHENQDIRFVAANPRQSNALILNIAKNNCSSVSCKANKLLDTVSNARKKYGRSKSAGADNRARELLGG